VNWIAPSSSAPWIVDAPALSTKLAIEPVTVGCWRVICWSL